MTFIPHYLRTMQFDALCDEAARMSAEGMEVASREVAARNASGCSACGRNRAEARLRLWIADYLAKSGEGAK